MIENSAEWWEEQHKTEARSNRLRGDEIERLERELAGVWQVVEATKAYSKEKEQERDKAWRVADGLAHLCEAYGDQRDEARRVARGLRRLARCTHRVMEAMGKRRGRYETAPMTWEEWDNIQAEERVLGQLGPVPEWLKYG